ncbi:MAG: DUF4340 domain-containing protein [Candidatus Omnitrophica bacterium]|nr:DUF4340 domain-containing protein [Candidatus Omnitrophota bacterium]
MSGRRTLFFLLILIFLTSFYWFKIRGRHPAESNYSFSTEAAKSRILSLDPNESVRQITIRDTAKETELSFSKSDDQAWRLTKPVDYPAESVIVDGFIGLLKFSPRIRSLSFDPSQSNEFGFDQPELAICMVTNLKSEERCLLIGSKAAVIEGAYAKWRHESKYFLVDPNFLAAFDKTLYTVRKKKIFYLLEKDIRSIQFHAPKAEFEITRSGKDWMLEKPKKAMLGKDAVNTLLVSLENLFVKEFLDTTRMENRKLGLNPGERIFRVVFQDHSEQTLIQGKEASGRDAFYALAEDGKTVVLISSGKLNQIEDLFRKLC